MLNSIITTLNIKYIFIISDSLRSCQDIFIKLIHNIYMRTSRDILNTFSDRLRDLINEGGWSIARFAKEIKIPRTTVNGWLLKLKIPGADYVCMIADFFHVSADYLLGREY